MKAFIAVLILLCARGVSADDAKPAIKNDTLGSKEIPVVVTAKSLFADNKANIIIYKENVVAKKGDITLYAAQMVIHLKKNESGQKQKPKPGEPREDLLQGSGSKIDTIVATGNVKIIQQDKTATSDVATYYSDEDKFVLTGKPRVWQGDNVIVGTKISYNIKEDTFYVDDANTVLYQQQGTAPAPGQAAGAPKEGEAGKKSKKGSNPGPPRGSRGIPIR